MKRTLPLILLVLFILLASGCATVSTSGNYTLPSGQTLRGNLVSTSGNTTLEKNSRVTGNVLVTSGNLVVDGEVDGDIISTSGTITLGSEAVIHGNIWGTTGTPVQQAQGAVVEGQILTDQSSFRISGSFIASLVCLFCILPLALLAGLILIIALLVRRRPATVEKAPPSAEAETATQKLKQLKQMLEDGLITEAEFEAKKAEILGGM